MNKIFFLLGIAVYLGGCRSAAPIPVNEKLFINLGGNEQYVEMTGESDRKPVLLFIHGGPGWPQTPYLRYFNAELSRHFILVSWDQAGCGQSYLKNPHPSNLSLDQLISDAHQLTGMLKEKFDQKKFTWPASPGEALSAFTWPIDFPRTMRPILASARSSIR